MQKVLDNALGVAVGEAVAGLDVRKGVEDGFEAVERMCWRGWFSFGLCLQTWYAEE